MDDPLRGHPPDTRRDRQRGARRTGAHVVGLSILSGSHLPLVAEVLERMRAAGLGHVPVVVGGIIPDGRCGAAAARSAWRGSTRPKDFELNRIMFDIVALAEPSAAAAE